MAKSHHEILAPSTHSGPVWSRQWQLMCPACGDEIIDRANRGPDHESVTVSPDRDEYDSPLGTRGGYVRIDLECSGGHSFAFVIGNHKGAEFLGVIPSK
ncbi:hypothetical protein [Streptomyces sp. CBMA156]|uniref:hypothetical protein n=1 Tax=Streptomyces sp. CBMA156 TaxID=1930280 RepID=UPI001661C842|nr:hypothetical protein [Streptomyces sp. CBMA156]MBD0671646.1 hypothetical protein [Streptomyces sp. CBMA156]